MGKVYFDLDGVLRNFDKAIFGKPQEKWQDRMIDGQSVYDYIDQHLDKLVTAEPTKYLDMVVRYHRDAGIKVPILSSQPERWWSATLKWLDRHLPGLHDTTFVATPEEKLQYLQKDDILIDDHPVHDGEGKVVMVATDYNKHCKNKKIVSRSQLKQFLETFYSSSK